MEPTVTFGTGENLGAFTVNADRWQMTRDTFSGVWKILSTNEFRRQLLILLAVGLFFVRLKARARHRDRERRERKKARIWSEEMNKK